MKATVPSHLVDKVRITVAARRWPRWSRRSGCVDRADRGGLDSATASFEKFIGDHAGDWSSFAGRLRDWRKEGRVGCHRREGIGMVVKGGAGDCVKSTAGRDYRRLHLAESIRLTQVDSVQGADSWRRSCPRLETGYDEHVAARFPRGGSAAHCGICTNTSTLKLISRDGFVASDGSRTRV